MLLFQKTFSVFFCLFFISQIANFIVHYQDPLPVLQSMKIHGVQVVSGKVTVPNDKEKVETKNVEAVFDIGCCS